MLKLSNEIDMPGIVWIAGFFDPFVMIMGQNVHFALMARRAKRRAF